VIYRDAILKWTAPVALSRAEMSEQPAREPEPAVSTQG
jgi:hypothetical protein